MSSHSDSSVDGNGVRPLPPLTPDEERVQLPAAAQHCNIFVIGFRAGLRASEYDQYKYEDPQEWERAIPHQVHFRELLRGLGYAEEVIANVLARLRVDGEVPPHD